MTREQRNAARQSLFDVLQDICDRQPTDIALHAVLDLLVVIISTVHEDSHEAEEHAKYLAPQIVTAVRRYSDELEEDAA